MKHRERKGFFVYLCILVILMVGIWIFNNSRVVDKLRSKDASMNAMEDRGSRPSQSGWLHLQRTRIFDENDEEVVLHGVSLHGISWFSQFVNENLFAELSNDWNTNIIRIPIYSTEYVDGKSKEMMELLKQAIQYAIDNDMYIIVDWHILDDKNPNVYKKDAKNFFYEISSEYGDIPNIIYEICNEPNGDTTWDEVRRYANEVIPVIRFNTKKSLIVVGTPDYCRDLNGPLERPIVGFGDIMYSYHFYASSHYEDMRDELQNKINLGVPVFITECGLSEESGEGYFKQHEISSWFKLVEDNHLSFCMWSMSNKDESSAMINSYVDKTYGFKSSDLSDCGKWVRAKNRGEDVPEFTYASNLRLFLDDLKTQPLLAYRIFAHLTLIIFVIAVLAIWIIRRISHRKFKTYADTITHEAQSVVRRLGKVFIIFSIITTINYLIWRIVLSIPFKHGKIATVCSIILLIIEIWGFCDTIAHYISMIGIKEYKKPEV